MRKQIKKAIIVSLSSILLLSSVSSANVSYAKQNDNQEATCINDEGFFKQYKNFNKYILSVDEIDEVVADMDFSKFSFKECNSEIEHIEMIEYTYSNKNNWKVIIYGTKETIEKLQAEYK